MLCATYLQLNFTPSCCVQISLRLFHQKCFFNFLFIFTGVHEKIGAYGWTETIEKIMKQYKVNVTKHCFEMVANGYTSIKLSYLASILGKGLFVIIFKFVHKLLVFLLFVTAATTRAAEKIFGLYAKNQIIKIVT